MCNIFIFDPGTTIKTGSLMTFNDVTQISDPNIEAYDTPNQFGSKSLTGYTYGSATDYVSRDVKYVDRFGNEQTGTARLVLTTETAEYKNKSGVEYFQVITAMTMNEMNTKLAATTMGLLKRFISDYRSQYQCKTNGYISDGW